MNTWLTIINRMHYSNGLGFLQYSNVFQSILKHSQCEDHVLSAKTK